MQPSLISPEELLRHAADRADRIQVLEDRLAHEREMRAMDACWLVRNTDLSRSSIAGVLGISRVTLNQYLKDAGMDEDYLAMVRARQQEQGVVLFSPDISAYLATGESE